MDLVTEKAFLEFIYQKTGILLQAHQLPAFRKQILIACEKFSYHSAGEYLAALQQESHVEQESDFLISAITVGETYFFRYSEQVDFLTQFWLLKQLQLKKNDFNKSLCIWSAGCSTGEEVYSLAILLDQYIPDIEQWTIRLFGTDINKSALEQASKGIYTERALRKIPLTVQQCYFDKVEGHYKLKPFIVKRVSFSYFNLNNSEPPLFEGQTVSFDLIVCNNVFIYFNQLIIRQIMRKFECVLKTNGCLLLAPADITLAHKLVSNLSLKRWKMLSYFQPSAAVKENLPLKTSSKKLIAVSKSIQQQKNTQLPKTVEKTAKQFTIEIEKAEKKADWQLVLKLAENALSYYSKQVDFWQYKAQALAHLGKQADALQASTEAVKQEISTAYPLFFHAMLQLDNNNLELAQQFFRKALFFNWEFPECHFHFAQLLVRLRDKEKALKHFEAALAVAQKFDSEKNLENESEITYAQFIDILEYEIIIIKQASSFKVV